MSQTPTPTAPANGTMPTPTGGQTCITMTPGKNGYVPPGACNAYYNFEPHFAPAVAVAVIFSTLTAIHFAEAFIYRKTYMWIFIMGCLWEAVSFIFHSLGAKDQQSIVFAMGHQLLYLLAPLWINAFAYMTFARMIWYWVPEKKIWVLPATRLSLIFVGADIVTFLIQGAGGLMVSPGNSKDAINTGINVYITGLALQQFFIFIFIGLMVIFHLHMLQVDAQSRAYGGGIEANVAPAKRSWKPLHFALYGALTFISVRVIFRLAEFGGGMKPENPIPWHEEYSYALDAFPMILCMVILAVVHPGRSLVGPDSEFPTFWEKRRQRKAQKAEEAAAAVKQASFGAGYRTDSSHSDRRFA